MRITIILGPFYPVPAALGGAVEKVQLALAAEYAAAGHDVTIISRRFGSFPEEEVTDGVRHIRVKSFDRHASLAVNLLLTFLYDFRAARALPVSDVTVTNSFFLPLLLRKRRAGKIYLHVARYPKKQHFLYRRADRLQAVSTVVADAIVTQNPRLREKVMVVANPLSEKYYSAAEDKPQTILFVGRLAREKGVELLIRAFSLLVESHACGSHWKLRIVGPHAVSEGGDGTDYLNDLKQLAAPLGERCAFIGPVFDENALVREYASAAIFVYPSLAERGEASPLAPLEAMASGCATIVSDLRCFDDFVVNGQTALKFDHRHPEPEQQLRTALARLTSDPSLIQQLSRAGRSATKRFRASAIAAMLLKDFQELPRTSGENKSAVRSC